MRRGTLMLKPTATSFDFNRASSNNRVLSNEQMKKFDDEMIDCREYDVSQDCDMVYKNDSRPATSNAIYGVTKRPHKRYSSYKQGTMTDRNEEYFKLQTLEEMNRSY